MKCNNVIPVQVGKALADNLTGKPNPKNVYFHSEIVFRHVIPALIDNIGFLGEPDRLSLYKATPLCHQYEELQDKYSNINPKSVRGFAPYKNFRSETDFNWERIRLTTAALFKLQFHIDSIVWYLGGTHTGSHRDVQRIRQRLYHLPSDVLDRLIHGYVYGSPKKINATNSEANFLAYFDYGDHLSCAKHIDEYRKVMIKDSRRGNSILFDPRALPFCPHVHLTPQGIVDVNNLYKWSRPVFNSSFRPDYWCKAINDWVDTDTEGDISFIDSYKRFLRTIWNLRILYPTAPIMLGDDDIKNAFRLIKNNPTVVGMHEFVGCGLFGVMSGQSFGDNYSPANFDITSVAQSLHAKWLWKHEPEVCLQKTSEYVDVIKFKDHTKGPRPFAPAAQDSKNPGVIIDGEYIPTQYIGRVDDHLYVEVEPLMPLAVACSIVSVDETFGGNHEYQEMVLSEEKLHLQYKEQRILLGRYPDSRSLWSYISPR